MSQFTEDLDDLLGVLLPLDGSAGPARRISRQKAFELVRRALEAAHRAQPSEPRKNSVRGAHGDATPHSACTRRSSH
jgi:hypothetical protein